MSHEKYEQNSFISSVPMMILMQLIATVMLLLQVVPNLEDGGVFGICNRLNVPPPTTRKQSETEDESDSETLKYPLVTKVPYLFVPL